MSRWPTPDKPGPGQESVWDYPRPPRLETFLGSITIELGGRTIASTDRALARPGDQPPADVLPAVRRLSSMACCGRRRVVVVRVEGPGELLRPGHGRRYRRSRGVDVPDADAGFRAARRRARGDGRTGGPLHRQRRAGPAATRRLLRRLDHQYGRRPVQGHSGLDGLVAASSAEDDGPSAVAEHAILQVIGQAPCQDGLLDVSASACHVRR